MKPSLHGVSKHEALYVAGAQAVVVNTRNLTASVVSTEEVIDTEFWIAPARDSRLSTWEDLARHALDASDSDVTIVATGITNRAYTVPKAVASAARTGLQAARTSQPGVTAVGRHVGSMLAKSAQVSRADVEFVNRFFKRNTAETAGAVRWNLWGGDAARSWSSHSMSKLALAADATAEINLLAFYDGDETHRTFWAERDGENALSLYKKNSDDSWQSWGNGDWFSCESPDKQTRTRLVELDDDTAMYVAGSLYDTPDTPISLRTLDPEEWDIHSEGLLGLDWDMVERVMASGTLADGDGIYTPDERSKNAGAQLRDKNGRFAKTGDHGTMKSGTKAEIISVDPVRKTLVVKDAQNNNYLVPAADFEVDNTPAVAPPPPPAAPAPGTPAKPTLPPLDLSGILGQPRSNRLTPKAWLDTLLQPMGAGQLKEVVANYEKFIADERAKRANDFPGDHPNFPAGTIPDRPGIKAPPRDDYPLYPAGSPYDRPVDAPSGTPPRKGGSIPRMPAKPAPKHGSIPRVPSKPAPKHGSIPRKPAKRSFASFSLTDQDDPVVPIPQAVEKKPDPETTDVQPLHLAIVDRDDPQAVTDLVSLVPAEKTGGKATAYRRVAGEWVEDTKVLQDMRSPTPPPVVKLDDSTYQDVLTQVDSALPEDPNAPPEDTPMPGAPITPAAADAPAKAAPPAPVAASIDFEPAVIWGWAEDGSLCAITAAGEGGLDRDQGNAEKLRRYWLYGKGGAKIRWNTGGDWTRCVRYLSKYLGPRAKGYCALRHHEATGMWTGDRRHRQERALAAGGALVYTTDDIKRTPEIIRASADAARATSAKQRVYGGMDPTGPIPQDASEVTGERSGRGFTIPLVIPEGLESGDGRTFDRGALSMRSFPIPLLWQIKTGDGHDGSFVVGRVDSVQRTEDGLGNAYGVFDTGPYGQEAQRLVEQKMLRWVSADLDRFEADEVAPSDELQNPKLRIKKGRLMGITLVAKPAFQECTINLTPLEEMAPVADGTYESAPVAEEVASIVASSGIASRIPVEPPNVWFNRPPLNGPTPISVTDSGQVYGHIATWDVNHIGLPGATRAPRSASNYAYFHTGVLRTEDGNDVTVGQLTLAGGHASMNANAAQAVKHYDDTGSAICDVHAGEDNYGIWVAGALRPGTTPEQVRALRASAPSGDWRVINGRLELVAVCQVNVPGFPVTRAQVASGAVFALVAAGTEVLARMKQNPVDELATRILALETYELRRDAERREQILSRMEPIKAERVEQQEKLKNLAAAAQARVYKVLDVDGYLTEFKDYSPDKRQDLVEKRFALKDGSFAIENPTDLRRALHAYGHAPEAAQASVRRHIVRRARALSKLDSVPEDWAEKNMNDLALIRKDQREVITAAALSRRAEDIRKRLR